ncbi:MULTISPECIES: alpha/beta fold hydrolase [unclassified Duganella]|uniref:alpha/beta fold hydrolase n=1 Tax=unclassified Duganella TaxID=2636909 RepID=UPI0006FF19A5|nr:MULTISPECIES: alpha/beta hydrolase [unclassified Duganella]KQV61539.1 chloroperoxidase [Duganella sp. Root336D2]KRB92371.1 chloroperoxidase [Duganella sp. Root198D2]
MSNVTNPDQLRRNVLKSAATAAAGAAAAGVSLSAGAAASDKQTRQVASVTTRDGVELYYKDWGPKNGQPVVFSHGWPLNSDSWESQMIFLADQGYRCIAHDRRGHGRSSQPWDGNDMDHYADDLAHVIEVLDLKNAVLVGFSTGGGEVARYVGRHGTKRVAGLALVSAVPPLMLKTPDYPGGLPREVFDGIRAGSLSNRSQLYKDIAAGPFFGFNRPGAKTSQGLIDAWWMQGMMAGHKNTFDSIKAFSETDFRADLRKFDKPTLIIHGDDDQIVPIDASGRAAAAIVKHAKLLVYPGAPHGLTDTHKDRVNNDLLAFIKG